ncbi:GR28B protein, partial [Acromyrmex charruanus]
MYPNFIISKILGIFPYRVKASSFETSKPRYILWTIIFCVICVCELTMLYKLNISGNVKTDIPRIIYLNFYFLYGLFLAVISYALSGPRIRLLQTILDVSSKLPQKSYQKLFKLIHTKDIFGFFFHFWLMLLLYLSYSEKMVFGLFEMSRVFISLLGFQMDMLYINCVCVLKACFKEINDNLKNLRELLKNNISRWIYNEQRHPFLLKKLKTLKKQHLMISDTVKMLNMIFSLHLLATIALSFKQIIFFVYFDVIQWQNGISLNQDRIYNSYFISVIIYYFTRFVLIVWACETGKNEAIKIGTTIHDILNSIRDVQIKDELNLFSLQILHCDNTFSAKGLTIDATLFTVMVNSVSTYLLILIQFLIITHSCDIFSCMLGFQMDMLYTNCICVLKACFKEINDNLENLRELVINNPRWIYNEQKHPLLIKLKTLEKHHLMINDTVQMLNMTFSLHLFAFTVLVFKQIIFFVFALIVWACETGKNEARKIGTTIHDTLNSISDVQMKDELNLFSLQILHCNNTFSAKGLTIDATLFTVACFKEINNNLENLRELMINNLRKIYHEQRHPFLLIKLKALKKQHLMISDTVKMLNMIFSLHLLATIALSFKQIIFYVYSNVIQWQNGISWNQDEIDNAYFISALIYYFTKLILIVWVCETGKNEAIKIGTIIHDVLNGISDVQIKDELNLFSLQILHCDNTFSAKGLTIDATLLTVMVSSISTYLLILIQFLIMAHSCDSKTKAI